MTAIGQLLEQLDDDELRRLADRLEGLPAGTGARLVEQAAVVTVPALMSVAKAAAVLGVSPRTVRRRISGGALPALNDHGRVVIRGDELRAYIDRLRRIGDSTASRRARRSPARFDWLREN